MVCVCVWGGGGGGGGEEGKWMVVRCNAPLPTAPSSGDAHLQQI